MRTSSNVKGRQVTIGDLVVAVTDAAIEVAKNERKAYRIANLALRKILRISLSEAYQGTGSDYDPKRFH